MTSSKKTQRISIRGRGKTAGLRVRKEGVPVPQRMSDATKKRIIAAIDEELRAGGISNFAKGAKVIDDAGLYVAQGFNAGILVQVKEMLDAALEPPPEQLDKLIEDIKKRFIYELRPAVLKAFKELKKKLPYRRGGGRPETLPTEKDKSAACDAVSALLRKKVPLRDAFVRVAQEFTVRLGHHVSARSVQRAWQGRNWGY